MAVKKKPHKWGERRFGEMGEHWVHCTKLQRCILSDASELGSNWEQGLSELQPPAAKRLLAGGTARTPIKQRLVRGKPPPLPLITARGLNCAQVLTSVTPEILRNSGPQTRTHPKSRRIQGKSTFDRIQISARPPRVRNYGPKNRTRVRLIARGGDPRCSIRGGSGGSPLRIAESHKCVPRTTDRILPTLGVLRFPVRLVRRRPSVDWWRGVRTV